MNPGGRETGPVGSRTRPRYARYHFITPHAVRQFRVKIADLAPDDVIAELNRMLQPPRLPVDAELREDGLSLVYLGWLGSNPVYIPVMPPDGRHGDWPYVPTVYGRESKLHGILVRAAARKAKRGGFPPRPWTEKDDRVLAALRERGYTLRECAVIMRRGHETLRRRLPQGKPYRRWTTAELDRVVKMRLLGLPLRVIARGVGRSENAVKIRMHRLRRARRTEAEKLLWKQGGGDDTWSPRASG